MGKRVELSVCGQQDDSTVLPLRCNPVPDAIREAFREGSDRGVARDILRFEAEATAWLGAVKYNQGKPEEAERLGLQAREWLERTSDTYFQVQNLVRPLALLALARDDAELAERWMLEAFPIVPLAGNVTLSVAVLSYDGQLNISIQSDPDAIPDLGIFVNGLRRSLDELAAGRASGPGVGDPPAAATQLEHEEGQRRADHRAAQQAD